MSIFESQLPVVLFPNTMQLHSWLDVKGKQLFHDKIYSTYQTTGQKCPLLPAPISTKRTHVIVSQIQGPRKYHNLIRIPLYFFHAIDKIREKTTHQHYNTEKKKPKQVQSKNLKKVVCHIVTSSHLHVQYYKMLLKGRKNLKMPTSGSLILACISDTGMYQTDNCFQYPCQQQHNCVKFSNDSFKKRKTCTFDGY